ncbi:MAG: response regulator transcription factor [Steroidobacteraceae bacterium]
MSSSPAIVYVVDDDPGFVKGLELLFMSAGWQAKSFTLGLAFLEAYPKLHPGCIFLDLAMPGMGGFDVLHRLRAAGCRWPVIILTGQGSTANAVDAIRAGAFAFLEKPLRPLEVLATVRRAQAHLNGDAHAMYDEEVARRIQRLSPRERDVFEGVLQGLRNKQIAGKLAVSEGAIKSARRMLMTRMQARSRVELITLAIRGGMTIKTRS